VLGSFAMPAAAQDRPPVRAPDVMYVPTPQEVVDAMLRLADVKAADVVYDLGSGDGRIPITAAREFGIRAVGIDIDQQLIAESQAKAKAAGVDKLVSFRNEDLFTADFSEATVVTLFLHDTLNERLKPRLLAELKPGTRIVSHVFRMGDWEPQQSAQVGRSHIYLWTLPERAATPVEPASRRGDAAPAAAREPQATAAR
jgi:SAM-dependent methyltransferase